MHSFSEYCEMFSEEKFPSSQAKKIIDLNHSNYIFKKTYNIGILYFQSDYFLPILVDIA